jgi:mannan endo-1,4-beta-mannosidase
MRPRSRAATAGSLLAACALALLCLALPAAGQAKKQRLHPQGSRLGEHRALIHRHQLGQRKIPARRHRAGVARRRAVVNRQAPAAEQAPGWVILPSPSVAPAQPKGPFKSTSPRGISAAPPKESGPVASGPDPEAPPVAPPEETPSSPAPPGEETPLPPPPAAPPEEQVPPPPKSPAASVYWGASIGDHLTGEQAPWDMGAVSKFEEAAGKKLSLVNFFAPFANCSASPCSFYPFATGVMENIREHGAIPVFSWSSQSIPSSLNEPDFQLSDVIAGTYDSYIREFAEAARDWGHPFFLRFNWEMNGGWFSWSEGANGNQPGEFVAAWRHVHDIFSSAGATNVSWVWCPNVDFQNDLQDLSTLYPGDAYVDWTGLDGYNWGTNPAKPDRWRSFDELYSSTYQRIAGTIAPSKPLLIGEIGSTEFGGSKASWISEALAAIPARYPMIRGLLWFDTFDDGMDWPIETSASASGAFAAGIGDPAYATSAYGNLSGGLIQPPS